MFDYEIICYRVIWKSEVFDKWNEVDFYQEEFAAKMIEDLKACDVEYKLLKILAACL